MAYNTKPIVTDVDGNPISQYYNPTLDKYEVVEGSGGGNKVVLYNQDGSENNSLSLLPILDKLSQLTGTMIDEETRKSNELQRIAFFEMLQQMLIGGELQGEQGIQGIQGKGLQFNWDDTQLGVRVEGDSQYVYVNLKGEKGDNGDINNLTSQHIIDALGYIPISQLEIPHNTSELANDSGFITIEDVPEIDISDKLNKEGDTLINYAESRVNITTPTAEIDLSQGNVFVIDSTGNITLSIVNPNSSLAKMQSFTVLYIAKSGNTVTFPSTISWRDGIIPDLTYDGGTKVHILNFTSYTSGHSGQWLVWLGLYAGWVN